MSVPTPYRNTSKILFLENLYQLNAEIGLLVSYMPGKYQKLYGNIMIRYAMDALMFAQQGNSVYLSASTTPQLFDYRIWSLIQARSRIYAISSVYHIYINLRTRSEHLDRDARKKEIKRCERAITWCNLCIDLISGTIKSNKEQYAKYQSDKHKQICDMSQFDYIQNSLMQTTSTTLPSTFIPINPFIHIDEQ